MKTALILLTTGLACMQISMAGMKIPRHVFKVDKLEEAEAKAAEKNKPIAYVLMDPGTT